MINEFLIDSLRFLKIKNDTNSHNYLGVCKDEKKEVFVPTLKKMFSYKEVEFIAILTVDYLKRIPELSEKVNYDSNDVGNVYSYCNEKLSLTDIKKIEKYRNLDIKKIPKR